jgi:hypothetical protein
VAKTVGHFCSKLPKRFANLPDRRDPDRSYYPTETIAWSTTLLFLLGLGSRRQYTLESQSPAFVANLNGAANTNLETAPHDHTIAYYLNPLDPAAFETLPADALRDLIRMKALDRWRLAGRFLVAIDGTGQYFYRQRHCDHCLTQKAANGETLYFHHVLEAKLVTANGFAFSMATEFIENTDPDATKQDCELKAFPRLAAKLKAHFPQLPITILADNLYACKPVFDICKANGWRLIFTFKRGGTPALFAEYETLRDLATRNRVELVEDGITQHFAWVNDLDYHGHRLCAFECREQRPDGEHYFAWITNARLGTRSVVSYANQGGRLRWKIENEGFNIQKNHGYALEHAYSANADVAKSFYFFLQLAHTINQLILKGSLLRKHLKQIGTLRNYFRRLAGAFRKLIPPQAWDPAAARGMQIRFT